MLCKKNYAIIVIKCNNCKNALTLLRNYGPLNGNRMWVELMAIELTKYSQEMEGRML